MINMICQDNQSSELEIFLKHGSEGVRKTEPNTKTWFALKGENNAFVIFDAFLNNEGRAQHFSGKVAAALQEHSEILIESGWQEGVLNNLINSKVLSSATPNKHIQANIANYIVFNTKEGKSKQLATFLAGAAELVQKTEPKTLFWFALQLDDNTFAIFDAFADVSGQQAHFSGEVAKALKDNSEELIKNGWEKGIVANIKNFDVIANI